MIEWTCCCSTPGVIPGADLAGWYVNWGKGKVYDTRSCQKEVGTAEPRWGAGGKREGESRVGQGSGTGVRRETAAHSYDRLPPP